MKTTTLRAAVVAAMFLALATAGTAPAGDYPRWRGASSNGSAGEAGMPLAEGWDDVRIAWVSEVRSPHAWNYSVVRGKTQWPRTVLGNGGYGMPAVWDGKIYLHYFRPAGTVTAVKAEGKYPGIWVASGIASLTLIDADGVMLCMDAKTGRTLWECVFPGREMNLVEKYGGHNIVCVANGKVYATGNTGWVYCVDARTGKQVWTTPLPSARIWNTFKAECLRERLKANGPSSEQIKAASDEQPVHALGGSLDPTSYNIPPLVADGVLVAGEWSVGGGLRGLDAETGKPLWTSNAAGGVAQPLLWRHKGREYVIIAGGAIRCLDPKTGKTLWSAGNVGNAGYSAAAPAIDGDLILTHGGREKGQPQTEGWTCYRMSEQGAEKVWALDAKHLAGTYIAPVIHRGQAWVHFSRASADDNEDCQNPGGTMSWACVDMASGKVLGEINAVQANAVCPGPVAMGDRLFYQGDQYVWMMALDPAKPKLIGVAPQHANFCSSATAADGFVYFRGGERLVVCLDVRKPSARPKPAVEAADPGNALYELRLPAGRIDGKDVLLSLRGRDGRFAQSWCQTLAPGYHYPDVLEAEGVQIQDGRLKGKAIAWIEAMKYEYVLDVELRGGTARGTFENIFRGVEVGADAEGTMRPWAGGAGRISVTWPRQWVQGQNQSHEHAMLVDMVDGKVTAVTFGPLHEARAGAFTAKATRFALAVKNNRLTGTVNVDFKAIHNLLKDNQYALEIDVALDNNLVAGKVKSTPRDRPAQTFTASGHVAMDESNPVQAERAVFWVDLPRAVQGRLALKLRLATEQGRAIGGVGMIESCGGLHPVDVSKLKVQGGKIVGPMTATLQGDGYTLKDKKVDCTFDVDLAIEGKNLAGKYKGLYDLRPPSKGEAAGTYRNE
jgi:outer membrane protein assembly factor BamB